ncbi:MAG: HAMP domain-containing protein, partial [Dehalococcoidia bacterium]
MPRWLSIKISHRILLGFGFGALLTLIVAAVSIYNLTIVGQRLTSIAEQDQLLLTGALELQVAVEQESDGIRGYLLSGDESFLEPFITGQSHYSETVTELEGLVKSEEDRRLLSDINTLHYEFLEIAEEEITLHEQGFSQSAIFLWQRQGNEIKSDLHVKLSSFVELREGIIAQNAREARAQQNQALVIALTLVVIAWAAGTAGGIWISRSITRPIKSLLSATEAISRGDLTTRTSIPGADELASLGSAMNQMVSDLAQSRETTERLTTQLRDLVDSLEQRVAERTRELEKLEELGRAIINAPPDASTLPDVLREYVPDMFPDSRIEICIFPV